MITVPGGVRIYLAIGPTDMIQRCGTETVSREIRGAIAAVFFHATNISAGSKEQMQKQISIAGSSGGKGPSAKQAFTNAVTTAQNEGLLSTNIYVQGGPGQAVLASGIEDIADLTKISAALRVYVAALTADNSKPLSMVY